MGVFLGKNDDVQFHVFWRTTSQIIIRQLDLFETIRGKTIIADDS